MKPNLTPSRWHFMALGAIALLALPACSDAKKALGFQKTAPDEFRVVTHAPLSLPPEYNLRPPQPGAARPNEQDATTRASNVLMGSGAFSSSTTGGDASKAAPLGQIETSESVTPSEESFLRKAGKDNSTSNIRAVLGNEVQSGEIDSSAPGLWDKIKTGTLLVDTPNENVLDAKSELEKIRAQDSGAPDTSLKSSTDRYENE